MNKTSFAARVALGVLMLAGAAVFCTGITWGLPSREVDSYLFGDRPVWTGRQILELTGQRASDPSRGADVDVDPLTGRDKVICVNETDAQRAEIVRRYRLYTYHPDEMVTMMALASMRPGEGDFDPKLYQYGGLWIYPVAVLLRLASAVGAITLTSDLAFYLDNPEEFGRFYVVARLYVVAWALAGVWAVFALARRLGNGGVTAATMAALFYIMMPVVVTVSHEAKPHLPGAILMLMTILAAIRYVDAGKTRWWIITGCLCGASTGMVLTSWPIFVVLPVMVMLRPLNGQQRFNMVAGSAAIGVVVYFVTNPYVLINLFANRALLASNLANTAAMFEIARFGEAVNNATILIAEGAGPLVAIAGTIGAVVWVSRFHRGGSSNIGWLLAVPALLILLQFTAAAAGQPGPYGRFALLSDIAMGIVVAVSICSWKRGYRVGVWSLCILVTLPWTYGYLAGFVGDSSHTPSRVLWAERLCRLQEQGKQSLAVFAEPAPYIMPPANLFKYRILLMPDDSEVMIAEASPDLILTMFDDDKRSSFSSYRHVHKPVYWVWPARISWADRVFPVLRKEAPK